MSFWVVVSSSLGLSLYLSPFMCLPSCVLLGGGVRLSGFLALFVSLQLLPSCVLLGGGVRLSGFLALFVSLQLSPFMCPSGWWCPAVWVSCFICLLAFVSLHVFFWVVVFDSLGFSLYSLNSVLLWVLNAFLRCPPWCSPFVSDCTPSCFPLLDGVSAFPTV